MKHNITQQTKNETTQDKPRRDGTSKTRQYQTNTTKQHMHKHNRHETQWKQSKPSSETKYCIQNNVVSKSMTEQCKTRNLTTKHCGTEQYKQTRWNKTRQNAPKHKYQNKQNVTNTFRNTQNVSEHNRVGQLDTNDVPKLSELRASKTTECSIGITGHFSQGAKRNTFH